MATHPLVEPCRASADLIPAGGSTRGVPTSATLRLALLIVCAACAGSADTDSDPSDLSTAALPEGESLWTGTMEVGGQSFITDFQLNLAGGDLRGTFTFRDDPESPAGFGEGTFDVRGTHDPSSGLVAIAPYGWVGEPDVESELLGSIGAYDGEDEELSGTIVDYASGDSNILVGGPLRATRVSGDGAPVSLGDGSNGLSAGQHTFAGTMTLGDPGVDDPIGTSSSRVCTTRAPAASPSCRACGPSST